MLAWRDVALWHDDPKRIEWTFETSSFESLYRCSGTNYFDAVSNDQTRIRLTGSIEIFPENMPGVPKLLARRIAPSIEKWLVNMVTPNFAKLPHAIQALLDSDR